MVKYYATQHERPFLNNNNKQNKKKKKPKKKHFSFAL